MVNGVSIIICCYNSAERLPETLQYLQKQQLSVTIPWEVIVINNASTDQTSQAATEIWGDFSGAPLRVVQEAKLGLSNARIRGFQEARYEFVSFVDDDNWVAANWVETVYQVMVARLDVGGCGGMSEAVFEVEPPKWYSNFYSKIAVGEQYAYEGVVTNIHGILWGAGLTIRKNAWDTILQKQEPFLLSGRNGIKLSSGEDNEICYILRLLGWQLYYTPSLKLKHFIPSTRLSWDYFCKMAADIDYSSMVLDRYIKNFYNKLPKNAIGYLDHWLSEIYSAIKGWLKIRLFYLSQIKYPGSPKYYGYLWLTGQLIELIKLGPYGLYQIDRKIVRWRTQ